MPVWEAVHPQEQVLGSPDEGTFSRLRVLEVHGGTVQATCPIRGSGARLLVAYYPQTELKHEPTSVSALTEQRGGQKADGCSNF